MDKSFIDHDSVLRDYKSVLENFNYDLTSINAYQKTPHPVERKIKSGPTVSDVLAEMVNSA